MTSKMRSLALILAAGLVLSAVPARAEQHRGASRARAEHGRSVVVRRASPRAVVRPYTVVRVRPRTSVRLGPRVLAPRAIIVGGPRLYRPYYTFRPRLSLGFGLWMGYPVAYPAYAVPYTYGYGVNAYAPGGLSFSVAPVVASVFVDGLYVGRTDAFGPAYHPLGVAPGRHRIELRAGGYRTVAFHADVVAGQVLPFRAVLRR
jgi:hypothetical protein